MARNGVSRGGAQGPQTLRPLPWEPSALAPIISERTIRFHYGKHHRGYVDKLNELIGATELAELPLADIVRKTAEDRERIEIYHNAAQAWNHDFYWRCLKPGGREPAPALRRQIGESFESFEALKEALAQAAIKQFGTGWGWLVLADGKLKVLATEDADNPLVMGMQPLLTIDVWEHAYYLDYQNERAKHVNALIDGLIDWQFVGENLSRRY